MPEIAAGNDDAQARRHAARAEPVRRLAEVRRHGAHRVLGDRRDERDGQDADADPRGQEVERRRAVKSGWMRSGVMKVRAKNPRTTLGMPARISRTGLTMPGSAGWRTPRGRSRDASPMGVAMSIAIDGHDQRAQEERRDVEDPAAREPADPRQLRQVDLAQEVEGLDQHRLDDERRDDDRRERGAEEQDAARSARAAAGAGLPRSEKLAGRRGALAVPSVLGTPVVGDDAG